MCKRLAAAALLCGASLAVHAQDVTELLVAVESNNLPKVQSLVRQGMDPDTSDPSGNTLLIKAAADGQLDMARWLIEQRARVGARNAVGDSAVMLAALHGHTQVVRLLAAHGADVNPPGWTPLHYCAWGGSVDVCSTLLGLGANVNARAPNGTTPLMMAAQQGNADVARLLLQSKADPNLRNDRDANALDWAMKYNKTDVADLIKASARPR